MRIRQLRQFVEVVNSKSINNAAHKLYISQSALSASLKAAEEELGQAVLERTYNGVSLTEFGEVFVEASRQILDIYDSLLLKSTSSDAPRLVVSSSPLKWVSMIFDRCAAEYADSQNDFRIEMKGREEVCLDVCRGRADIGVTVSTTQNRAAIRRSFEDNNLVYHLIDTIATCAMVGPKNPLYNCPSNEISLEDLHPYRRLVVKEETPENASYTYIFPNYLNQIPYSGIAFLPTTGSFQENMANTDGYYIGTYNEKAYKGVAYYKNVRALRIRDYPQANDVHWIRRKGWNMSPIARKFLRELYLISDREPDTSIF